MSVRLQVLLDETEAAELRALARSRGLTLSEWVRQSLREMSRRQSSTDPARKLAVIRAAAAHEFPTADVERMLAEIEGGYGGGAS